MVMMIMFLSAAAYYILSDLVPIYKEKQWKLFWIYTILLSLDFLMVLLMVMNVSLPSPSLPVKKMISSILKQ
jgi:hypothetical protein